MTKYDKLPKDIEQQIIQDRKSNNTTSMAFLDQNAIRKNPSALDEATLFRSNFIRDIDKILNCPFYNRYADKTQVFSFYKNDDITRRSLHVQLVSRIARTIGKALNLNLELIEAIALGHDLGHPPFAHTGESILDEIYFEKTKRHFYHNLQSVRVLSQIYPTNVTLQTLDGIAGHNGEMEMEEYYPILIKDFSQFEKMIEECYTDREKIKTLSPSTLEGCLVRICDIIAYLGKDRQDGTKTNTYDENNYYSNILGVINAEIVNNLSVNIIKNSYNKNYIKLDKEYFLALKKAKNDNYSLLYSQKNFSSLIESTLKPMFRLLYDRLYQDLINKNTSSPIFTHHIDYINKTYYKRTTPYTETSPDQIVVDYIASMTDDYFVTIFNRLFPNSQYKIKYNGYFWTTFNLLKLNLVFWKKPKG